MHITGGALVYTTVLPPVLFGNPNIGKCALVAG